jgi:hypothetical protein
LFLQYVMVAEPYYDCHKSFQLPNLSFFLKVVFIGTQ